MATLLSVLLHYVRGPYYNPPRLPMSVIWKQTDSFTVCTARFVRNCYFLSVDWTLFLRASRRHADCS